MAERLRTACGAGTIEVVGRFAGRLTAEPDSAGYAADLLRDELDAIDVACSRFRTDSGLAVINDVAGPGNTGQPAAGGRIVRRPR